MSDAQKQRSLGAPHGLRLDKTGLGCLTRLCSWFAVGVLILPGQGGIFDRFLKFLAFAVIALILDALNRWRVQRKRDSLASKVLADLRAGKRYPFYLYLRPFLTTLRMNVENTRYDKLNVTHAERITEQRSFDFETVLARALWKNHPFVALGRPGESFGAGRVSADNEAWRQDIRLLMENAKAIFVIPAARPGIKWELECARASAALQKCIFIMPPHTWNLRNSFASDLWEQAKPDLLSMIGFELPNYRSEGLLFRMAEDGKVAQTVPLDVQNLEHSIRDIERHPSIL